MAQAINAAAEQKAEIDEDVLRLLAFGASADLNPMAAMFGGVVGQEVVKAASGKFHPLFQWIYFDAVEALPPIEKLTPEECGPQVQAVARLAVLAPSLSTPTHSLRFGYNCVLLPSRAPAMTPRSQCLARPFRASSSRPNCSLSALARWAVSSLRTLHAWVSPQLQKELWCSPMTMSSRRATSADNSCSEIGTLEGALPRRCCSTQLQNVRPSACWARV